MVFMPSLMVCNVREGIIFYINPPVHRYTVSWSGIPTCQSAKCQISDNARKKAKEFILTECKYRICCYYNDLAQCLSSRRTIDSPSRSHCGGAQTPREHSFVTQPSSASWESLQLLISLIHPHPELRRKSSLFRALTISLHRPRTRCLWMN